MKLFYTSVHVLTLYVNAVLSAIPFMQCLKFKENKSRRILLVCLFAVFAFAASVVLYYFEKHEYVYWAVYTIAEAVVLACFIVLYEGRFLNKFFIFISSFYIFVLISFTKEGIYCLFEKVGNMSEILATGSISENIIQWLLAAVVCGAMSLGMRSRKDMFDDMQVEPWIIVAYVISMFILPVISMNVSTTNRTLNYAFLNFAGGSVAFLIIYFQYFVLSFERKKNQLRNSLRELNLIEYVQKETYKKYEEERKHYEFISEKCHDLRKQINILQRVGKFDSPEIERIRKSIDAYDTAAKTGNPYLDVLISDKAVICKNNKIDFACLADGSKFGFLDIIDLYAIFGNAIDNAIEYLVKIDEKKRYLRVKQTVKDDILLLCFENYVNSDVDFTHTSKADEVNHGFGIKSIIYSAEKYKGSVNVSIADNIFSVEIIFCL